MALAAIVSCLIWAAGHHGDNTVAMIMKGMQIRSDNASWMQQWSEELHTTNVAHKTILLTGGSRGLGRGIAAHLLGAGARLILPMREVPSDLPTFRKELELESRGLGYQHKDGSKKDLLVLPMDLSDLSTINRFVTKLREEHVTVDVLINNAGLISLSPTTTAQGFEMTMGVNFVGTAHLTLRLDEEGVLAKNAVVVSVGSEEHRNAPSLPSLLNPGTEPFGNENFSLANTLTAYGRSKLALAAWSYELSRRWKAPRVVRCVCPGPVVSDIARSAPWPLPEIVGLGMRLFFQPANEAALPIMWLALSPMAQKEKEVNWHMSQARRAGQNVSDPDVGKWIWGELSRMRSEASPT